MHIIINLQGFFTEGSCRVGKSSRLSLHMTTFVWHFVLPGMLSVLGLSRNDPNKKYAISWNNWGLSVTSPIWLKWSKCSKKSIPTPLRRNEWILRYYDWSNFAGRNLSFISNLSPGMEGATSYRIYAKCRVRSTIGPHFLGWLSSRRCKI